MHPTSAPMADLHPPELAINGASVGADAIPVVEAPGAEAAADGGMQRPVPPYSKRRRRPSVRLGDIDAPLPRRNQKSSSSHPRPPRRAHPDDGSAEPNHRRGSKPPAQRRPRTAWIPTALPGAEGFEDEEERYYDDEDHSDSATAAAARARVSGSRDASGDESDGVADWGLPNGRLPSAIGYSGVRAWLDGLGLSRYAPVFQIHEVDDEVLPLLTLEDLKDMGVGAVGSRRKMYAAIQKLQSDNAS
jgi:hypothetical protein